MISKYFHLGFLLLLSFLIPVQVLAVWALKEEASIECLHKNTTYRIKKDGTWIMEEEVELKALTESGRQELARHLYTYDATTSTFTVLEAKTINGEIISNVPIEKIEDKPLASDPTKLSNIHQIFLAFENVSIGSIITIKYIFHFFKAQIEGYFSKSIDFREGYLWTNCNITFESELPLFTKMNDPRNSLDITENKQASSFHIMLRKPIFEYLTCEPSVSVAIPSLYTSFSVSTEQDYGQIGRFFAKPFEAVLRGPLPRDLEEIQRNASTLTDEVDCIDTIVIQLINKITYLSNETTLANFTESRPLQDIISSGQGDCKEYSTCLAALLRNLGYTANIALINRGQDYIEEDTLPCPNFNHALVKAIGPSGKIYWVDPTNNVTMAGGIFPDIADRPVLVLDPYHPLY